MNANSKLIGLVGGVGPWAGWDVHRKILESTAYEREQECVSVVHLSFPGKYADRTDYILGKTSENPAAAFVRELELLDAMGVGTAAIVCNTAHAAPIFEAMSQAIGQLSLRYVNIITEAQRALEKSGKKRVGLLATLGTCNLGLYADGFDGTILCPGPEDRQLVHDTIYHAHYGLKTHYPIVDARIYDDLEQVMQRLADDGAEAIVLGCTELPLLDRLQELTELPVFDPNRILAEALVKQVAHGTNNQHVLTLNSVI